jgi:hypothetical protein
VLADLSCSLWPGPSLFVSTEGLQASVTPLFSPEGLHRSFHTTCPWYCVCCKGPSLLSMMV